MKYKHFIFDLDCTLTESRTPITEDMIAVLKELIAKEVDVAIITGHDNKQIDIQMVGAPDGIIYLSQSGNHCVYWKNKLKRDQRKRIMHHIAIMKTDYGYIFRSADENDLIEDRGSQITLSMVGHHAPLDKKKIFDPTGGRRSTYLKKTPFDDKEICARVAGTASIDYTLIKGTKGVNLRRLMKKLNWRPEDCVYVGDKISPSGNDGTVIGVIPNLVDVVNPEDTLKIIKELIA